MIESSITIRFGTQSLKDDQLPEKRNKVFVIFLVDFIGID